MTDKPAAPGFDEPLEMLAACHERIEDQLATLERMVPHLESRGCDAEARSAAQAVLHYFETEGVLHHRDEDEDLFPLLRILAATHSRPEVAAALDELEREHASMQAQWERLRTRLQAVERGEPRIDPEEVARFAWLYRRHMDRESAAVLPFAREALDAAQRAALGERMAARRKISLPPKGANTK